MPDPEPKLRVIDERAEEPAELVRLGARGVSIEPVRRLPGRRLDEAAARLESKGRENFDGRSMQPGMEAILDQQEVAVNVEQPWGVQDGRLAGVPYGWFVLIALTLVAGSVWSVIAMRQGEIKLKIDHGEVRQIVAKDEEEIQSATLLVEEVERVVAAYLRAETIDELLPLVRDPERVRPMIEKAWSIEPKRSLKFLRMSQFDPATLAGRPFWMVCAEVKDGEMQNLLVEQAGETGVKVDWETHVCWQPMPWNRFVAERPDAEALDFRVWAVPDTFYSHDFSDSGRWICYRLSAKEGEEHLFGYAPAGGEVATELEKLSNTAPQSKATVILRLRWPKGSALPRCVLIEKVVAPRWALLDGALQDSP